MKLPQLPHGHSRQDASSVPETAVVRKYRFLLQTAPIPDLVTAHADGLTRVSTQVRQSLLGTLRDQLLVGQRVGVHDTDQLAKLLTHGERTSPGALLNAYDAAAVEQLASAVVGSEHSHNSLSGYPDWDGRDPAPGPEATDSAQYHPDSRWSLDRDPPWMGSLHN